MLTLSGCTGRQNPGHYKPGTGESWTGNPVKTNASALIPSLNMTEKMASSRARSLVVLPRPHTNGLMQLECDLPKDAAAVTMIAMVGTSTDVF